MVAIMRGRERIKQINEDARGFALTVTNCLRIIDNQNMDDGASGIKATRLWYCASVELHFLLLLMLTANFRYSQKGRAGGRFAPVSDQKPK